MFFHIFTHVKANDGAFVTKHILSQSFRQFSFTNTGRAKEEEAAYRSIFIFKACTSTTNRLAHSHNSSILTDNAFVKLSFQFEQSITFAFSQLLHGNTSPRSYNFCHIISSYDKFLSNFCQSSCQLALQFVFFIAPFCGKLVLLLCYSIVFFQLHIFQFFLNLASRQGAFVKLNAQSSTSFVHQVNCLVRQISISNISIRKFYRSFNSFFFNTQAMEFFVTLTQA